MMPVPRSTRRRKLPGPTLKGFTKNEHQTSYSPLFEIDCTGKQITVSEGNDWPPPSGDGIVDVGSDFYTTKSYVAAVPPSYVQLPAVWTAPFPQQTLGYKGHLIGADPSAVTLISTSGVERYVPNFPPTLEKTPSEMDQLGTTAIARCKPGEPIADASTFLGELMKDGLPALPLVNLFKGRQPPPKSAGGEYLNYQFGIQPIVNDISKFVQGVTQADKRLRQLERDSGRVVRRRYSFPSESSFTDTDLGTKAWPFRFSGVSGITQVKYGFSSPAPAHRERHVSRKVWFSGAFTYYLPDTWKQGTVLDKFSDRANAILGLDLTAETLWNLAPWSWAVDWFSSAGDTISNLQDFLSHGLVMHYGYLMVHTIVTDTYYYGPVGTFAGRPVVSSFQLVTETKQRKKANPFGFGVSWSGLSPYQLSIAAALGLSRGR